MGQRFVQEICCLDFHVVSVLGLQIWSQLISQTFLSFIFIVYFLNSSLFFFTDGVCSVQQVEMASSSQDWHLGSEMLSRVFLQSQVLFSVTQNCLLLGLYFPVSCKVLHTSLGLTQSQIQSSTCFLSYHVTSERYGASHAPVGLTKS